VAELVSILIPTWNNPQYAQPCVRSLLENQATTGLFHIYLINNGHPDSCNWADIGHPQVTILHTGGKNLGWEGGLALGLEHSKAPFVCFFNDDAYIAPSSRMWLNQLLQSFKDPKVGAVGPASNVVMGWQNIFTPVPYQRFSSKFLIGFCMVVRRSALDEVGGVDTSLPGGDDFDLSIRLRDAGYKLMVDRDVFVFHHGFKTGERVFGTSNQAGGWNSYEFKEKTDFALIRKHGFAKWWELIKGAYQLPRDNENTVKAWEDSEAELIRERVQGETILDLGCGSSKTVEKAIGVDMVARDETITTLTGQPQSAADVVADVSQPLPFEEGSVDTIIARHILEHMIDPITAIKQWTQVLKPGGRLILAVPLEGLVLSIPMNIEHKHAWTPDAMKVLLETVGLKVVEQLDSQNGVSFITVATKEGNGG